MKLRRTRPRGVALGRAVAALAAAAFLAVPAGAVNRPLRIEQFESEVRGIGGNGSRLWVGQFVSIERKRLLYSLDISRFEIDGSVGEPQEAPVELPRAWDDLLESGNDLWFATEEGLLRWPLGVPSANFEELRANPSRERAYTVIEVEGELWLGTLSGIYRWSKDRAESPRPFCEPGPNCPLSRDIKRTVEALAFVDSTLWIGSDAGLHRWRPGAPQVEEVKIDGEEVSALRDTPSTLWVGTELGLYRLDKKSGEVTKLPLATDEVNALFVTGSTLWVGAERGLFAISGLGTEWKAGVGFTRRLTSSYQPDQPISIRWKIEDFGGRTTAALVEQRVIVRDEGGRIVGQPALVPRQAHIGEGVYEIPLDPLSREGGYSVEVEAKDLLGAVARSGQMAFEVARPRASRWLLLAAGLGVLVILFTASVQLRRRVLILLGRRWRFVGGGCDFEVTVEPLDEEAEAGAERRVRIVSKRSDRADPNPVRFFVSPGEGWPPASPKLGDLKYEQGSLLHVAVDEWAFRWPWAHVLAGERGAWGSGAEAVVAGQLALTPPREQRLHSYGRRVVFAGLSCERPAGGGETLHDVPYEVGVVAETFRAWGAVVTTREQADVASCVEALRESDVLHVASHASLSGVELADRRMTTADLTEDLLRVVRCRLVVLSACDAGRIEDRNSSFVFRLVCAGVNVLAATNPVDSAVCVAFFQEFYRALLPGRSVGGVRIADAIRTASAACARRFDGHDDYDWRQDVNSFILYGDPSLRLELTAPGRLAGD